MSESSTLQSRRNVLGLLTFLPVIVWSSDATAAACFDLAKLPDAGMRRSLNFRSISQDPKKNCGGCAFFTRAGQSDCGKCVILSGGPTAAQSVCDSWAAKG